MMGSAIAIVIVVVVVIGIVGVVAGPVMAANSGGKVGSVFSQAYCAEYGSAPSAEAEKAISNGTAIILNAMGGGQYALPSANLEKCIKEYGSAVGWNESKMELGLGCLMAVCCNKNGNPSPGCQWAVDVIMESMMAYCPAMMSRVIGR